MTRRPLMIALYAAGLCAGIAIIAGIAAMIAPPTRPAGPSVPIPVRAPSPPPTPTQFSPAAPTPPTPAPSNAPPLTVTSPAVASNGRLTIRLLAGQPER